MQSRLSRLGQSVLAPFRKARSAVLRSAVNSTSDLPKETRSTVEEYEVQGGDFSADLTKKYWHLQATLLNERFYNLYQELYTLCVSGPSQYSYKSVVLFLRWVLRCVFLFMLGIMIGRQSMHPLVLPSSPFVYELKKQYDV